MSVCAPSFRCSSIFRRALKQCSYMYYHLDMICCSNCENWIFTQSHFKQHIASGTQYGNGACVHFSRVCTREQACVQCTASIAELSETMPNSKKKIVSRETILLEKFIQYLNMHWIPLVHSNLHATQFVICILALHSDQHWRSDSNSVLLHHIMSSRCVNFKVP